MIDNMEISVTEYLMQKKNYAIKSILNAIELSNIDDSTRQTIRKIVLDEINELHMASCRTLTYIQEKIDGNKS